MILLLGGSGYVGTAFRKHLAAQRISFRSLSRAEVDYTNGAVLARFLANERPDFVINCAGYTGQPTVDECERHKAECLAGNAVLPGVLRQVCEQAYLPWGHVSSGCIYTGARPDGSGFTESDPPNFTFRQNNCSFYSGTKALGEEVLAGAATGYIWRLRIPFTGVDHPRNYLSKMLRYDRLLEARNSLSQLDEFARASVECWQKHLPFGTYNLTNPGSITTREVVALIQKSGVAKKQFNFFNDEAEFMRLAAKTPRSNCVLDTTKLQQAGVQMTEIHEAIAAALREWKWN